MLLTDSRRDLVSLVNHIFKENHFDKYLVIKNLT